MPRHLTIATVLETNRIASETAFLELIEFDALDHDGSLIETVRLVNNTENVNFGGNTYQAASFTIDITNEANEDPSVNINASDPKNIIRDYMEVYDGGVEFPVRMYVVNSDRLNEEPEISETFKVIGSSAEGHKVKFTLGAENPLRRGFPMRLQYRDRCTHEYKGPRCKYSGGLPTCDYTMDGPNGCVAHGNEINFGGFPGMKSLDY